MRFLNQAAAALIQGPVLVGVLALSAGCIAPPAPTEARAQRQQLLLMLEREMNSNTGWVRVHAAEALLDHQHALAVAPAFAPEADTAAPPYRIGVWRVLARAAASEDQRRAFIERIHRTMLDPRAPDRVHAAESLAKLTAANPSDDPMLVEWLGTASDAESVYPLWLLVLSQSSMGRASNEDRLGQLLDSSDSTARLRAAFALGRIKSISPASIARLNRCLELEPEDSPVRGYVAAASLRHTARDSSGTIRLKQVLTDRLSRGQPAEQLEAAMALGRFGTAADRPALTRLLLSAEADARIGAASGLLYLYEHP